MGYRFQGLSLKVQGSGFTMQGLGFISTREDRKHSKLPTLRPRTVHQVEHICSETFSHAHLKHSTVLRRQTVHSLNSMVQILRGSGIAVVQTLLQLVNCRTGDLGVMRDSVRFGIGQRPPTVFGWWAIYYTIMFSRVANAPMIQDLE